MSDTAPTDIIAPIDETSDLSERFNPLEERRRAIYERSKAKFAAKGTPIDANLASRTRRGVDRRASGDGRRR